MKKKIAVLAGDGIGPEIMAATIKILDVVAQKFGHQFEYKEALIGGAAYDVFGEHLPQKTLETASECDAVLFGSVGGPVNAQSEPKWKGAEKIALLGIRKHFNFNINVRPTTVWRHLANVSVLKPEVIDQGFSMVIIRELSEGIYFGEHKTFERDGEKVAQDVMEYREGTIEKVVEFAFKTAMLSQKRLCSVDKANVLDCSILWREVVERIAKKYPEVQVEHMYVDNAAMQLVKNPRHFDVIVTENTFGDILSDLSSVLPGSLGLLGSASFNDDGFGLYEPSGGSAPDIAGLGIASPIGMLLSAAMMLKYSFGMLDEAICIEEAVKKATTTHRTGDIFEDGCVKANTAEFVDECIRNLTK